MGFWEDKRVLVTGGAGFLGSRIVAELRKAKAGDIIAPRSKDYNLIDLNDVRRLFRERPDVVIHAAAVVGGIQANDANPGRFFYENLMMGIQTMEEARLSKVKKFVSIGTICAYPGHTDTPFDEMNLWMGYPEYTNAPYGLAKKMLLVQGQAYRRQYGFNAIYLLPTNLMGPGDNFSPATSHVIPALIRKCCDAIRQKKKFITAWGTGFATREFLYVDDCAEAVVLAAEKYNAEEPVNIGTGKEIPIKDLTEMIVCLTGFKGTVRWDPSKPDGQPRRCLNVSRAKEAFGFTAKTSLEEGLKRTIAWWKKQG